MIANIIGARTKKKLKQLAKYLDTWYWKTGQVLIVDTYEVRTKDSCGYDVCLYDPKKKERTIFLFTLDNYRGCGEQVDRNASGKGLFTYFDSVAIASTPFYLDRCFMLPKMTPITSADIERCARYFIDNVLGLKYRIWNIRVVEHEEEDNESPEKASDSGSTGVEG